MVHQGPHLVSVTDVVDSRTTSQCIHTLIDERAGEQDRDSVRACPLMIQVA